MEMDFSLERIEKMIEQNVDYEELHLQIFFYLCQFYCENIPKKEADDFMKQMIEFSKDEISHTFKDHMKIYEELLEFYKANSECSDFIKLQQSVLSYFRSALEESKTEKKDLEQ